MQAIQTGWRGFAQLNHHASHPPHSTDKKDLFEAAKLCCQVMKLPASCRFLLDQLCAAYGGEPVQGGIMVWPSNDYLESRTGICERTIRHALRHLITQGIITSNDSPNGKRFARKNRAGTVTEVFGFDLSPMLHRLSEFRDRLVEIQEEKRRRSALFDQITITRRSAQEALRALVSDFPHIDASRYEERFQALSQALPRRSSKLIPTEAVKLWAELLADVVSEIDTASGGNICRHKDTNTKALESPCDKSGEENNSAELVRASCPDAVELLGRVRDELELFEAAERYRGTLGVSRDGWLQARQQIGDTRTAILFFHVVQLQARPAPGVEQIRNLGGYFRAMVRMIATGVVNIEREIGRRQK